MFTYHGETSTSVVSAVTFSKYEKESKESVFNTEPGIPFYLFQWHLTCSTTAGAYVDAFADFFYSHETIDPPVDPDEMTTDQKRKLFS